MKRMKHILNKQVEVIGVDHGWSNMKTSSQIFLSGIKEITTEPAFFDNILEYEGRFYKVGTGRLGVAETKVMAEFSHIFLNDRVPANIRFVWN